MVTVLGVALAAKMRNRTRSPAQLSAMARSAARVPREPQHGGYLGPAGAVCMRQQRLAAMKKLVAVGHASGDIVDLARLCFHANVDGNEIITAHDAVAEAIAHIRSGKGPYFRVRDRWWQGVFSGVPF